MNTTKASPSSDSAAEVRTCPRCGLTETMLRTEGLMGCADCYEIFADLVIQAAAALQGIAPALPKVEAPINAVPTLLPQTLPAPRQRKPLSWLPRRAKKAQNSSKSSLSPFSSATKKRSADSDTDTKLAKNSQVSCDKG